MTLKKAFAVAVLLTTIGCGSPKPAGKWDESKWGDATWAAETDGGVK